MGRVHEVIERKRIRKEVIKSVGNIYPLSKICETGGLNKDEILHGLIRLFEEKEGRNLKPTDDLSEFKSFLIDFMTDHSDQEGNYKKGQNDDIERMKRLADDPNVPKIIRKKLDETLMDMEIAKIRKRN